METRKIKEETREVGNLIILVENTGPLKWHVDLLNMEVTYCSCMEEVK